MLNDHLKILGFKAEDIVTGFSGVISSVSFDLYGCVQAVIQPAVDERGSVQDGRWFDTSRLKIIGKKPVMEIPCYDKMIPQKVSGGQQLPTKN